MSLIKCGECGGKISDETKQCPNCGKQTIFGKEKQKKRKKNIIIALVLLSVFSFIILIIILKNKEQSKILGTWENETSSVSYAFGNIKKIKREIDTYVFENDGKCINIVESFTDETNNFSSTSTCEYKIRKDKISITWTDDNTWIDENNNEVKSMEFSLVESERFVIIDDIKYEKK